MLYLADSAGGHIRTVKTKLPICDFSVSPDSAKLVFVPCHSTDYGGPLYLLDINAGVLQKLSVGPYWRVASDAPVREVYADPEFSPDNASVVFTVRKVPINGHADLVEASGPLAIMQLGTRHVHLVQSTLNLDGNGPAFANQPHWSPDGATILVSFETGFAVLPRLELRSECWSRIPCQTMLTGQRRLDGWGIDASSLAQDTTERFTIRRSCTSNLARLDPCPAFSESCSAVSPA